ncbi:MAG: carboxypeptidase-like regulatory domain-containing protein, partial [Acidobacteriota bacterium]
MGSTASLEGEVSGPGGVLLPEIEVSLYRLQGSEWQFTDWQNTGGDGRYAFAGLEDGSYTLLFRDWSQTFAFSYYDGASQLDDATAIVIAGAGMTVDAQLELAGRITGALTDPGGRPLDVPLVFVFSATDEPEVLFLTNPDPETGAYDLGGLPTGDYLVQFTGRQGLDSFVSYYDGSESFADATPVPVVVGETTADIDGEIGLPPGGVISGQITDPYGRAFDHARVEALAFEDGEWLAAGSAETAFYESEFVLPLAPGSYRLRFEGVSFLQPDLPAVEFFDDVLTVEGGTDVVVGLDQTLDNFDVVVGNLAQGSLSGTVTDDASGLPLAGIEVYPAGRGGSVLWDQVVTTGIDGTYTVSGLWPGGYSIELYDPSFAYQTLRLPAPVLVGEGAVTGVDGALTVAEPGSLPGSISGRVTGPGGEPLFNVRVTAGSQDEQDPAFGFAATDSDGRYRIRSLPTGSYLLHFSAPDGFRVPEWYDDAKSRDQATPVMVVDAADSAGIDAELAPAGAIQGSVTDRFGNDFFITTADAYVPEGADWRLVASTAVVNEAEYRLDGVPVGDVRVRFSGRRLVGDPLTEVYDDVETLDEGTDVPVVGGEVTADVDAILGSPPTGAIAGQVTDGGGAGLAGIAVRVYDDRFELEVETVSETDGSYTAAGLLNGRFYVEFSDPAGVYPSEAYDDVGSLTLGTPVMVVDGGTTAGIDAALDGSRDGPGGGGMRGVVTDAETGAPLADVRVHCLAVDLSFDPPFISSVDGCSTTTGADGRYQLA